MLNDRKRLKIGTSIHRGNTGLNTSNHSRVKKSEILTKAGRGELFGKQLRES